MKRKRRRTTIKYVMSLKVWVMRSTYSASVFDVRIQKKSCPYRNTKATLAMSLICTKSRVSLAPYHSVRILRSERANALKKILATSTLFDGFLK